MDGFGPSEALPEPSPDSCEVTVRPCHQLPRSPRFEMFEMRRLGIDEQPGGSGESRAFGGLRQAGYAERAPDPRLAAENARGELGHAGELAGAPGEDHAAARIGGEQRSVEP